MEIEWNNLPIDVLEMIVKSSTQNARNALRACSIGNKELVETTRLNSIYHLKTKRVEEENEEKWEIHIEKDQFGTPFTIICATYEILQNDLIRILEHVDYVKVLDIDGIPSGKQLNLKRNENERRIRVESVQLHSVDGVVVENVLSQIEPVYLRQVEIVSDGGNSKIYDMPQIIDVEMLHVSQRTSINEAQLLKLGARDVDLAEPSFGLRNYFQKCSLDVGRIMPRFKFRDVDPSLDIGEINIISILPKKELLLDTDVPDIKLKLAFEKLNNANPTPFHVEGTLFYEVQSAAPHVSPIHQAALRRIETLFVFFCDIHSMWTVDMIYKFQSRQDVLTDSIVRVQQVLDTALENVDHVKELYVGLTPAMQWKPRTTKLIVTKLVICAKNFETIKTFLQQIDPIHLKYLKITTQDKIGEDFDMPHIYHLENLTIRSEKRCRSNSDTMQMINWDDEGSSNSAEENVEEPRDRFATEKFINQYLKHVIRRLNKKTCYFNFHKEKEGEPREDRNLNLQKLLEGVDVIGSKRNESDLKLHVYVDSPYPEYVILLIFYQNEIDGRRERRKCVPNDIEVQSFLGDVFD